jgi:chaperonin GroES
MAGLFLFSTLAMRVLFFVQYEEKVNEYGGSMTIPIKPLADRVVAVREEAKTTTASGLYLPDSAKEKPATVKVVAIGPDVTHIAVGDLIVYKDYTPTNLKINDTEYLIINEEDVLATIA